MQCTFSQLKDKDVINLCNGKRLGSVCDLEIDTRNGRITKLLLPGSGKCLCLFSAKEPVCIPWQCIERIGDDAILVRFAELPDKCGCRK